MMQKEDGTLFGNGSVQGRGYRGSEEAKLPQRHAVCSGCRSNLAAGPQEESFGAFYQYDRRIVPFENGNLNMGEGYPLREKRTERFIRKKLLYSIVRKGRSRNYCGGSSSAGGMRDGI